MYLCRDVPAAVWQQLGQAQGEVLQKLRKATFKSRLGEQRVTLRLSSCCVGCGSEGLRLFSFARCFDKDSKGAEGVAGLLLALSHCQLLQDVRSFLGLVGASSGFPATETPAHSLT